MEKLIIMQDNLGLGYKGKVIITTQSRVDENRPWIAELPSSEVEIAMILVDRCNTHDAIKDRITTLELDLKFAQDTSNMRMDIAQKLITENQILEAKIKLFGPTINSLNDCVRTMKAFSPNNPFNGTKTLEVAENLVKAAKELK